jgi:hypothetical protein
VAKLPYSEGDVFGVPLDGKRYALGVVGRVGKGGRVVLGYFFGRVTEGQPTAEDCESLRPEDAVRVVRFGDLHLMDRRWPVVSRIANWDRREWPMAKFVRNEPGSNRVFLVRYSDTNPLVRIAEQEVRDNSNNYETDSLFGALAIELVLAHLLLPS